jgi:hypothetical protein
VAPPEEILHEHAIISQIDPLVGSQISDELTTRAAVLAKNAATLLDNQHHYQSGAAHDALHIPFPLKQTVSSGTRRVPLEAFPELPPSARLISVRQSYALQTNI